jgi:hypothetical protein
MKQACRQAVIWRLLWCGLLMLHSFSISLPVYADDNGGFVVNRAEAELENGIYYLHANADYNFSKDVLEAIMHGVPIVMVLEFELFKERPYLWDEDQASLKQRFQLQYHALSEQYIVSNLNSGDQYTAMTLHSSLYSLRDIKHLPIIDKKLLLPDEKYYARVRVRLSISNLPVPLKMVAYFSRSWWLLSDWYQWQIQPAAKRAD